MNILFLSDIHFGRELIAWGNFEKRAEIQEQLIHTVATLPENMKPDYIVVTGDIAWTGAEEEYEMAYDWFSQLLSATGLTGEKITFCAGNHDVNRKVAVQIPLSSLNNNDGIDLAKVDDLYKYENINPFNVQIHAYNDFCHRLGVIPYLYYCDVDAPETDKFGFSKQWYSYTVGSKDIIYGDEKYRIVAFNTAMLSGYEELPDDENFLGLPQIEKLISQKTIGKETQFYKIALFHHSERFLNTNEMNSYSDRPATLHRLMGNVDLALCGHTETGAVPVLRKQDNDGILLNGGAAYYSDDHPNAFSILRIEPNAEKLDGCTFIYSKGQWNSQRRLEDITWNKKSCDMRLPGGSFGDEPWKYTVFSEDDKKEIIINHMDFGFYADAEEVHYHYVNNKDITRLLHFYGDEEGVHFGIAPGRKHSVTAMIERLSISHFIEQQYKMGKEKVEFKLTDSKGNIINAGILDRPDYKEDDDKIYNLLMRLKKLEEVFHVRFSTPDKVSAREQCAIDILENFLEDGGGIFSDITQNKFVYFSEKRNEFQNVYESLSKNKVEVISISYRVPIICELFGAKIKLGDCRIIISNLVPCDLEEIKRQADTFISGDRRRMTMRFFNNLQQILILKDGGEKEFADIQAALKKIEEKSICFEVAPQELSFGINIFKPDQKEVDKKKIKLSQTVSPMIEVYRELWRRN